MCQCFASIDLFTSHKKHDIIATIIFIFILYVETEAQRGK